jgi:NitT/TauT family transport system permease protein
MAAELELAPVLEQREVVEAPTRAGRALGSRAWSWLWPKLVAIAIVVGAWQVVVWSGWRPDYVLPGPLAVFKRLGDDLSHSDFYLGVAITLRRALVGYVVAAVAGTVIGILVARITVLRRAIGSAILGLQSMPSIAWFPLAILLFQQSETAIIFVVILGAAPAIAAGLLSGVDHVQPLLIRVGRVMGARGLVLYWHVILPAALPAFVGGLKQGWAFAWRSLMAGEIIVIVSHSPSIGQQIQFARDLADAEQLLAIMVVIFVIGVVIDSLFGTLDRAIRLRWGLVGADA